MHQKSKFRSRDFELKYLKLGKIVKSIAGPLILLRISFENLLG